MEWWDPHSQGVGANSGGRQSGQSYTPPFHPLPPGQQPVHPSAYEQVSPTFQTTTLPAYPVQTTSSHLHSAHFASTRSTAAIDSSHSSHNYASAYHGRAPEARRLPQYPSYEEVSMPAGPVGSVFVLPQPSTATGGAGYTASAPPRYLPPTHPPQQYAMDSHRRYTEPSLQHLEPQSNYLPPQRHSYAGPDSTPEPSSHSNQLRTPSGPVYWSQSPTPTPFWAGDHLPSPIVADITSASTSTSHHRSPVPPIQIDVRYELPGTDSTPPLGYPSGLPVTTDEYEYEYDDEGAGGEARSRRTSATDTGSDGAHPGYGGYGGDDGSWSDEQAYERSRSGKRKTRGGQKRQRTVSAGGSDAGGVGGRESGNGRKFACEICGQRFARPSALATHTFTHTKQKPFSCLTCDRHFAVMSNLRRHCRVRKHVMESADRQRAKFHANEGSHSGGGLVSKPPSEEEYFDDLFQRERTVSAPSRGRTISGQSNSSTSLGVDASELQRHRHSVA